MTAGHVPVDVDAISALFPIETRGRRSGSVPVNNAHVATVTADVALLRVDDHGLAAFALPVAKTDPRPGDIVHGVFATSGGNPERMKALFNNSQTDAFSSVVDTVILLEVT